MTPEDFDSIKRIQDEMNKTVSRFSAPAFSFPIPSVDLSNIKIPTKAEQHSYESSGVLVRRLADRIQAWKKKLPPEAQPVIIALADGVMINVDSIGSEGHHGLIIAGKIKDCECMLLLHQSAVKLLCYIEKIEPANEKKIGFTVDGESV